MATKKKSKNKAVRSKSSKRTSKPKARRAAAKPAAKKLYAVPPGTPAVISGFAVAHCDRAVEFLKTVFGAKVKDIMKMPDGSIAHCDLKLGDSRIMCGEPMGPGMSQTLRAMLYVKNVDAVFAKALATGATVKEPLKNQFYGDRTGRVLDPCGNEYIIATHVEDVSKAEMEKRMAAMMSQMSAGAPPPQPSAAKPPPPPPQAFSPPAM
jgi:PhnB protein